jgi:hypothetical protein
MNFKLKIWTKYFAKHFIWLVFPLCLCGSIESCSEYLNASKGLTKYSVNVSGYHRSDGTYVRPYKRRPAGGVKNDRPLKNKMLFMGALFFLTSVGSIGSLLFYVGESLAEVERQKKLVTVNM